jgi:hypothetical protein
MLTFAICKEIQRIADMLGEERSAIILLTTKRLCVNPKMGWFRPRSHPRNNATNFLLEYLECLISIMEFSLLEPPGGGLVEDIRAGPRAEAGPVVRAVEVLPRDPHIEWLFEGLEPRAGPVVRAGPREALPRDPPVDWYFEGLAPGAAPRQEEQQARAGPVVRAGPREEPAREDA